MQQFIAYIRVSTASQGQSGLGLAAQKETIRSHLGNVEPIACYCEVESGRRSDRPELAKAIAQAKRSNATLVIAKLDRLTRSARFLLELLDSNVELLFCDLPQANGPAGRFLVGIMAQTAELEAGLISERTRAALAAAKARGVRLGARPGHSPLSAYLREHGNAAGVQGARRAADERAASWRTIFEEMVAKGLSLNAMARELDGNGDRTPRGGTWTAKACSRMIDRLCLTPAPVAG